MIRYIRYIFLLSVLCAVPASAAPPGKSTPGRFNVLFIAVDDLRPDLGAYGHPIVKSPNIDRLAKSGLTFRRAYCQQAVCNPSRASLMTGLRPETLGVLDLPTHFRDKRLAAVTIAEQFKAHGYHSEGFGKIFHTGHGNRDDSLSWSVPIAPARPRLTANTNSLGTAGTNASPRQRNARRTARQLNNANQPPFASRDVADNQLEDGRIADRAIAKLRQVQDQRFFLAVGFHKPHLPFIAPKKYWDLYDPTQLKLATNAFHPVGAPPYANNNAGELRSYKGMPKKGAIPDETARQLIHGYYASISYMDAQVGRVLNELDRLGLTESTVVVLWGDHGWQLGEHATWAKHTAWETATRAPLIIRSPGQKVRGRSSDALVEFVDIFPTLTSLCVIPTPEGLEGISFEPLLKDPHRKWKRAAFSVWPKNIPDQGKGMARAIRTDRYRLVEWSVDGKDFREYELYDHRTDPGENINVARNPENRRLLKNLTEDLHRGWRAARP